jgi:hypothetical protein
VGETNVSPVARALPDGIGTPVLAVTVAPPLVV